MEGDRYTKVCDLGNEKKIIVLHFPVASQRSSEISKDPQRYPEILRDIQRSSLVFYSSINLWDPQLQSMLIGPLHAESNIEVILRTSVVVWRGHWWCLEGLRRANSSWEVTGFGFGSLLTIPNLSLWESLWYAKIHQDPLRYAKIKILRDIQRTSKNLRWGNVEREKGVEPSTSTLARLHSTTELLPHSHFFTSKKILQAKTRLQNEH